MTNTEYHDTMDSLQVRGLDVKWYVHHLDRFNKREGYYSRAIALQVANQTRRYVTPAFIEESV